MKQITCEMCGSTDLMKQNGVFVCQSCGCKYSLEEAKNLIVEVEGAAAVQGTFKNDDSVKYNNLRQLAEDAFVDGRWDSVCGYCDEAMIIRPNDALIIAMYGLSVLGKENIQTNVPTTSINAMKRMFDVMDSDNASNLEKVDVLSKISNYLIQVCKTKADELNERIKELSAQKVPYSRSAQNGAALTSAMHALAGNIWIQYKEDENYEKMENKRIHNEAIDAQISKANSGKKAVESFVSTYMQQINKKKSDYESKAKEERAAAYWAEHGEEKNALELEMESVKREMERLQEEIDAVSKEVFSQVAELEAKKSEKIPEEMEVQKQYDLIDELEITRGRLSFFQGKEKKAITERINTIEQPKLKELKTKRDLAKKKHWADIEAEIARVRERKRKLTDEYARLGKRMEELSGAMTKGR